MSGSNLSFSRRSFILGSGAAALGALSGCTSNGLMGSVDGTTTGSVMRPRIGIDAGFTSPDKMYAAVQEGPYALEAIPYSKVPKQFWRQIVPNPTGEAPGTIVVSLQEHFLYLVQPDGDALRYGVGIGASGFEWSGRANVQFKREWPRWTPPAEMIQRKPELVKYRNGMDPGATNPLGARALYIYQNGRDTGYRIHGSPEWWSIGQSMSSGCIRLMNQDIIDLYNRVPVGTPIVVR
ncbi:L,D-transpeptidase family protein [Bartonella sp. LJL80]